MLTASRGIFLGSATSRDADGEKAGGAVDERGHEDAQHHLGGPVTEEVAEQPGRELGGRQLQRHDREPEDERDDGDDCAADGGQQATSVVRRALKRQRGQRRPWADDDLAHHRPCDEGSYRGDAGPDPEGATRVFPEALATEHDASIVAAGAPVTGALMSTKPADQCVAYRS